MTDTPKAENGAGQPRVLIALQEWETDTGKPASASEGNAFIDGFNRGFDCGFTERSAPAPEVPQRQLDPCSAQLLEEARASRQRSAPEVPAQSKEVILAQPEQDVPSQARAFYKEHYAAFDDGKLDLEDMIDFSVAFAEAYERAFSASRAIFRKTAGAPSTQKFPSVQAESTKGPASGVATCHDPGTKAGSVSGPKEQK